MKARAALRRLPGIRCPSEGIYYVVRAPNGWKLVPYLFGTKFGQQRESNHVEFWKGEVAPYLAYVWAAAAAKPISRKLVQARLQHELHECYYAFPRGRVDKGNGSVFMIRNGNNLTKAMPTKGQIERAFEIVGLCEWEFDSHEQCMDEDATIIRELLGIGDSWTSVEPQE